MNRKIKILYTIPNFNTAGSGKVVYDLVKNLNKDIFQPEICCFHNQGSFFKVVERLGVPIHLFSFTTSYKPYVSFFTRTYIITKFFKKHNFDIIHSWHWSSDFSEPLAAKMAGIPFLYTKKAMGWGNRAWVWRSKLSSKIIAINNDMMMEFFNAMPNKVIHLPLGVNTKEYSPRQKDFKIIDKLGIKKDEFIIVTVVNMVPVKGIEILIKAVNKIADNTIKLFIIGDDKNQYAKRLKNKYESNEIHFLGKKLDVKPYLSIANLFVIPTKNEGKKEGMPIAPLEAMAMGKIVLGSNISGINDILKGFKEYLFNPEKEEELINKIKAIKNLRIEEKQLIESKIREYIISNYSLEQFINNHELVYKSLV